jgi:multiple sugar transport system permease protein
MAAIAIPHPPVAPRRGLSTWQTWGIILLAPYVLVFLVFVLYPVTYGLWLARHPESFFVHERRWIRWLSVIFIIPWAVPAIPTIFSIRFMLNPEWGVVNSLLFRWFQIDGPNWLTNPQLAMAMAMLVHIWKALPFWTLILMAGRLAIPKDLYEAASVDGASGWQKFKYVTWPSMRTLYITSTLLSLIWTLGDFNSVYLLTGGQPADKTHVLATLGIRYIRLDQLDHAMATIVVALPFVLPLVYFMMKRLSGDEQKTSQ